MHVKRKAQRSIFELKPDAHPLNEALERMSVLLDEHPELLEGIAVDLKVPSGLARGRRRGLAARRFRVATPLQNTAVSYITTV